MSLKQGFRRQEQQNTSQHASTSTLDPRKSVCDKENRPKARAQLNTGIRRARARSPTASSSADSTTSSHDEDVVLHTLKPGAVKSMFDQCRQHAKPATSDEGKGENDSHDMSARRLDRRESGTSLGKRVLGHGAEYRPGPTIDFDGPSPPLDETEMLGESLRRKKARIIEGGPGELDLVPAENHIGFGPGPWQADRGKGKAVRQFLQLEVAREDSALNTTSEGSARPLRHAQATGFDDEQPESSGQEPSTYDGSYDELCGSQGEAAQVLTVSSSQNNEDEAELVALQLLPRHAHPFSVRKASDILALITSSPRSGSEDDSDVAIARRSRIATTADDSGFAEMDDESAAAAHDDDEWIKASDKTILPAGLTAMRRPNSACTSSNDTRLSRTPSGLLMPPPPLPSSCWPGQTITVIDAGGRARRKRVRPQDILAFDTQAPEVRDDTHTSDEDGEEYDDATAVATTDLARVQSRTSFQGRLSKRDILAFDTPEPSPGPELNQDIPSQVGVGRPKTLENDDQDEGFETQSTLPQQQSAAATHCDVDPQSECSPKALRDKAKTSPKLQSRVEGWNSLASAWAGAHPLTPPRPTSPRQATLDAYFSVKRPQRAESPNDEPGGLDDVESSVQCVPESQLAFPTLSVEIARAFQSAFETSRQMGRKHSGDSMCAVVQSAEDIVEAEGNHQHCQDAGHDMDVVPSSDQEDDPWSPLGSPVKIRYPAPPSPRIGSTGSPSIFKPLVSEHQVHDSRSPTSSPNLRPQDGDQEEREETQWESYWTTATPRIIPLEVDENDSLADMLRDSYEP